MQKCRVGAVLLNSNDSINYVGKDSIPLFLTFTDVLRIEQFSEEN